MGSSSDPPNANTPENVQNETHLSRWAIESSLEFETISFRLGVFCRGAMRMFFKIESPSAFGRNRHLRRFRENGQNLLTDRNVIFTENGHFLI